jgi:hypothetical protein
MEFVDEATAYLHRDGAVERAATALQAMARQAQFRCINLSPSS